MHCASYTHAPLFTNKNRTIVDIRLRPRYAIQPPLSRPVSRIACAHKFLEYYLHSHCILNDPSSALRYGRLNDPFCSQCCREDYQCLWMARKPPKLPLSLGICTPSNTWFLGPTRVFVQNGMSIGSAVFVLVLNAVLYSALSMGNCPSLGISSLRRRRTEPRP